MLLSRNARSSRPSRGLRTLVAALPAALFGFGCGVAPIDYETMSDQEIAVAKEALSAECNAILADGLFDEYLATGDAADAYAASKAYCRDNSSSASGGGGGEILGGLVKASGGGSSNVVDKYCQDFVTISNSEEETSLMTKTASPTLVNAWAECMTSRVGLACSQKPNTKAIEIVWDELNNEGELVKTTLDTSNMTLSNPSLARPTLPIGKTTLLFSSDSSRNSTLVFNGNAEKTNVRHSCTVVSKGSAGIRADVTKSWSTLTSRYASIVDALNDMRTSTNAIYVDQALVAANARYSTANAKKAACNNNESCSAPPLGSVFNITYKTPGLKCSNGKIIKSPTTTTRSAIELDYESMQFWMKWEASEAGRYPLSCSNGPFSYTKPKPYF